MVERRDEEDWGRKTWRWRREVWIRERMSVGEISLAVLNDTHDLIYEVMTSRRRRIENVLDSARRITAEVWPFKVMSR